MESVRGLAGRFLPFVVIGMCLLVVPQTPDSNLLPWDELEGVEATLGAAAVTTYYVSGTGNDSSTGTSLTTPFLTLQRAADVTNPGDVVFIMDGIYTDPDSDSDILTISRSGEPNNYIRYRAYPGHKPVLQSSKNWSGIRVSGAAYILIEGLTLIGNNDNVTLEQALTQLVDTNGDGKPDELASKPEYSGGGIDVTFQYGNFAQPAHHVIVRNNTLSNFGGNGIGSYGADFLLIEDNRVDSASWYSAYNTSGISFYQNRDTQPGYGGYRFVLRRNISSNNRNFMPNLNTSSFPGGPVPTDGNGIIIDDSKNGQSDGRPPVDGILQDFEPYTGATLIANNIVHDNFGRGVHVFESDNVTIINNTSFSNSYDPAIEQGEITVMNSDSVRVYNNIMVPYQYRSSITNKNFRSSAPNRDIVIDYNLSFGGNGFFDPNSDISDLVATRNNLLGVDPQFVGATYTDGRDFRLSSSSPAIDKGFNFGLKDDFEKSFRPAGTGVDIGAYEAR